MPQVLSCPIQKPRLQHPMVLPLTGFLDRAWRYHSQAQGCQLQLPPMHELAALMVRRTGDRQQGAWMGVYAVRYAIHVKLGHHLLPIIHPQQ